MSCVASGLSARISTFSRWFAGAGLLLMTLIIAWQVFARYVLNASPAWAEQAALLLMIWYVMFAAAAGVREGFHIRISVFANALPAAARRAVEVFAHAVVGLFGMAMLIWGTELTIATWSHVIPTLNLPRGVAYLPIPLSGLLIAGFAAEAIVASLRNREVSKTWN
jgi:TRAP-type C4-dicarboxylate transport system permease small subunit